MKSFITMLLVTLSLSAFGAEPVEYSSEVPNYDNNQASDIPTEPGIFSYCAGAAWCIFIPDMRSCDRVPSCYWER